MACASNYLPSFDSGKEASPKSRRKRNGFRETGYPESGPVRISFCLEQSRQGLAYSLAELGVGVKLCGLDGE